MMMHAYTTNHGKSLQRLSYGGVKAAVFMTFPIRFLVYVLSGVHSCLFRVLHRSLQALLRA
jgi:hypothetical protein